MTTVPVVQQMLALFKVSGLVAFKDEYLSAVRALGLTKEQGKGAPRVRKEQP